MAYELVYTSAPEGLTRGSSGFCVVACTKGLGPRLVAMLEGLSAYKPLYPHYAPNAWDNPVSQSHYLYEANGEQQHILSRVCFNGVDHTQRSNKLASHLVLSKQEALAAQGGPSSVLLHEELFKDASWHIKAEYYSQQREIPKTTGELRKCTCWEKVMGDAGWGGYLAQLYVDSPNKNVYIAYKPEQNKDILPLLHEAISLLPENLRWKVTFSTYFVALPVGMNCTWRCCPADSDVIRAARRSPANIIIDITKPQALAHTGELINVAQTGIAPKPTVAAAPAEPLKDKTPVRKPVVPETKPKIRLKSTDPANKLPDRSLRPHSVPQAEQSTHRKLFFIIAGIVCLLAAFIGSIMYYVSAAKADKIYNAKKQECQILDIKLADVQEDRDDLEKTVTKIQTEEDGKERLDKIQDLRAKLEEFQVEVNQLLEFQQMFEERFLEEEESIANPKSLSDKCTQIAKALDDSERRIKKQMEEAAKRKAAHPEEKTVSTDLPPPSPKEENKSDDKPPQEQTQTPVPQPAPVLPVDDPRYLWKKSKDFHGLTKDKELIILVGDVKQEDILIAFFPAKKDYVIGKDYQFADEHAHIGSIMTTYDTGKISIKTSRIPPKETQIVIKIKKQDFPLFFRLGISIIGKNAPKKENLKIDKNSLKITIPVTALEMPDEFYSEKNQKCSPTLRLKTQSGKVYELELSKDGARFVGEEKGLKDLQNHLKKLQEDVEKISQNPDKYLDERKYKTKKENYILLRDRLENTNRIKKIKKILGISADKKVTLSELKNQVEKYLHTPPAANPSPEVEGVFPWGKEDKLSKKTKAQNEQNRKDLENWLNDYETWIQLAKQIQDLALHENTITQAAIKKQIDQLKSEFDEDAIKDAMIVLVLGEKEYNQFSIKEILQ